MISKTYKYAVIGASNNPDKYGYKVLQDLLAAGFDVTPINHHEDEIAGIKAYHALADMPELPDVVVFVIPPEQTEKVLQEAKDLGILQVWMQPGAESETAVQYCKDNGLECVWDRCIMVERKKIGELVE